MSKFKLALEEHCPADVFDEPVPYDENIDGHLELVKMGQGIEQALESLQTLHKLCHIFAKQQNKRLNKSSIKIGKLALERIKDNVGIFKDNLIVSQECFTEDSVSLEGIKDIARSIWDAIVRTFKALWDAFAALIQGNPSKKANEQVKNDVQKVKNHIKVKKTAPESAEQSKSSDVALRITQPFQYLGEQITLNDLNAELKHILASVKIADGSIINLQVANMNMAESVRKIRESGITEGSTDGIMMAMGFFSSYVKEEFSHDSGTGLFDMLKQSDASEADLVDKNTLRTLHGVTRGHKLVAYMHALNQQNTQIHLRLLLSKSESKKVTMEYPPLETMLYYMENLVKVTEDWRELRTHYEVKSKKIVGYQKSLLASLQDLLDVEKFENERDEDSVEMLKFAKSVTNSMIKFSYDMAIILRALEVSAIDHTRVSSYLSDSLKLTTE